MLPISPPAHAPAPGPGPGRAPTPVERRWAVVGILVGAVVVALLAGLIALVWLDRTGNLPEAGTSPTPGSPADAATGSFLYTDPRPAPPLALVDQDGTPFDLASLRGAPVLVFFGYTHCPDVCPTTIGTVNRVLDQVGDGTRAVFVSVDPERDPPESLKEYLQFLPDAYTALTGTPVAVRAAADDWGISYARIDTGSAGGYAMAHTANLYLVDGDGRLRGHFPFGTEAGPIAATIEAVGAGMAGGSASPAPSAAPSASVPASAPAPSSSPPSPSVVPTGAGSDLDVVVLSTAIWSGGASPVLLTLTDRSGAPVGAATTAATAQLLDAAGQPVGDAAAARMVRPPGEQRDVLLAHLDVPAAGRWRVAVDITDGGRELTGTTDITVLDPGLTAPLGRPAPDARTPTVADAGGVLAAVTTDPQPDRRLSETSTTDARAAGKPYVLVVDSYRFRVSPACGRAIGMARFLGDRWRDVAFIHHEPYEYSLVSGTPVLDGDLSNPKLTAIARSWGLGEGQWGPESVPWVFVVDGDGIVRAKYTGVMGSDDIDVVLADLAR